MTLSALGETGPAIKLTELDARFYRYDRQPTEVEIITGDPATWRERGCPTEKRVELRDNRIPVEQLADAQCIWFMCPKCQPNGHYIEVTFADRGVLPDQGMRNSKGEYVRWHVTGSNYDDLTTKPSILIEGGCEWHGFITDGKAE